MTDDFVVMVVDRGRKYLYLRYVDPVDGRIHEKSAKTANKAAALKAAGQWKAELERGGVAGSELVRWEQFREDFRNNYLAHYSESYAVNFEGSLNVIEELMKPDTITRIGEKWLTRLLSLAKARKVSAATVRKYFQHLQTALKWAVSQGMLRAVPNFPKQTRQTQRGGKLMKGRPITTEEFERMLAAVEKSMPEHPTKPSAADITAAANSMRHLLNGLWLSGLRLGEALALTWDQWSDGIRIRIDDDGDVCLMIDGENQKNRKSQVYPVVDDFAEFLLSTPEEERKGFVFNVFRLNGTVSRRVDTVSDWIVAVGKAAKVKVDERQGAEKFASAHDIRRAFGTRWAKVIPAGILQQLMRHANIETTMGFYVNITAKDTMEEIRRHLRKVTPGRESRVR